MTEEQIKYMRDRFLNWTVPYDLNPDGGISFKRSDTAIRYNHPWPTGTNFLTATQAEDMIRYIISGMPKKPHESHCTYCGAKDHNYDSCKKHA